MRITVFTPTYNRAYILDQLYNSLKKQTFTDFEWLIIDDGSSDHTKELVEEWKKGENNFSIRYYWFENAGKPREINRALGLARGELFLTVDSDDIITPNALELIDGWEKSIKEKDTFCALAGSHGDMSGNIINPVLNSPYVDVDFFNRYPESGFFIGHDRPWVFYTSIHRKYLYPEFEGEKFITEAVTWNRMAHDGYKVRCFNDVIYLCEYQDDGLTKSIQTILTNNPQGFGLWHKELMGFFHYGFRKRFKIYYSFYVSENSKCTISQMSEYIGAPKWCILISACIFKLKHRTQR